MVKMDWYGKKMRTRDYHGATSSPTSASAINFPDQQTRNSGHIVLIFEQESCQLILHSRLISIPSHLIA
ncbi:hypothetical protein ACN38_g10393 [Penicillium nordicum]|uniref:Uncharacterized protein n=1 Tax=Penicillium nordicum TaxID=229535 RepID=A0A0M8P1Y8_9EURO|nr:hypothetical protein ACN38_g10393 [Penicillium nordicum]